MMASTNNPFKISATVLLCSSTELKLNIATPKLSHATRAIGAPLEKREEGSNGSLSPQNRFLTATFFLLLTIKKN